MIDPKELRIGNLIYKQSLKLIPDKSVVWSIDKVVPQSSHMYDPIPITPEWLERLFDVSADDLIGRSGCCLCEILPDIWLRYNDYGTGEILIEEYREGAVRIPHIRYVHQLQNLYFALTGEELKIKE